MRSRHDGRENLRIFGIGGSSALALSLAGGLGVDLEPLSEERFPDGELKLCPIRDVRGADAVVVHSLMRDESRSPNDKLCEIVFLTNCLRDLGAGRLVAVLPYLAYSRSDRRKDEFDPLNLKTAARMLESAGLDAAVTLEAHNVAAYQNAFRTMAVSIEAAPVFREYMKAHFPDGNITVLSPDTGGIARAESFRSKLQESLDRPVETAFLEKYRHKEGLKGHRLVGPVEGREVVIYDDMISTGGTALRAAEICRRSGAERVSVLAAHGLFSLNAGAVIDSPLIDEIVVTDTNHALLRSARSPKLKVLPCALLIEHWLRGFFGLRGFELTHEPLRGELRYLL